MDWSEIVFDDFILDSDFNLCHPDFGCLMLGNYDNLLRLLRAVKAIVNTLEHIEGVDEP